MAAPVPTSSEQSVRLLDAGDKRGRTMAFIATWDRANTIPTYVQVVRRADGTWSRHPIRSAGGGYGAGNGNYIPGLSLDDRRNRNRIYLGYRQGAQWHLAYADLGSDGLVRGTPYVLRRSTKPLARPVATGRDVMYQRLDRYRTYLDYRMTVKTLRLRP